MVVEKHFRNNNINLPGGDEIISKNSEIAKNLNPCFLNVVETLNIKGLQARVIHLITNIIEKFKNHPSVKIKENVKLNEYFHFSIYSLLPITRTSKGPMKMVRVNESSGYRG